MTKFWKLVTGAMGLKTHMQRHERVVGGGGYFATGLHVDTDSQTVVEEFALQVEGLVFVQGSWRLGYEKFLGNGLFVSFLIKSVRTYEKVRSIIINYRWNLFHMKVEIGREVLGVKEKGLDFFFITWINTIQSEERWVSFLRVNHAR